MPQALCILLGRVEVAYADRCVAGRRLAMLAPRIIEHTGLGSRVRFEVLEHIAVAAAAEAREPILDVSSIAGLRHLAVIDYVEACLQLPVDDEFDGARHLLIESGRVER